MPRTIKHQTIMKKLNKTQIEIEGLAARLPEISEAQKAWAMRTYDYFIPMKPKASCVCPNCKERVPLDAGKTEQDAVCPHCGAKLTILPTTDPYGNRIRRENKRRRFFQVVTTIGGWQVTRLVYMERWCYLNRENTPWEFHEVCQAWNNPSYATTYFRARPKVMNPNWAFNPYKLYEWNGRWDEEAKRFVCTGCVETRLEPRRPGGENYFQTRDVCAGAKILPEYKRMGIKKANFNVTCYTAVGLFQHMHGKCRPMEETLLKAGEYALFSKVSIMKKDEEAAPYFAAWKICRRRGYAVKKADKKEWIDLVGLLVSLGLDYRSPKYVCPEDLHAMHQRMVEERARLDEKKRLAENMKTISANEEHYAEMRKAYMDVRIVTKSGIDIYVAPSVIDIYEEGRHMHHCVFSAGYYKREESLILFARMKGERVETIEVDLDDLVIVQSRGVCNKETEWHKEIVDAVKSNMRAIESCRGGRMAS